MTPHFYLYVDSGCKHFPSSICRSQLGRVKRIWYLSPMRAAKVQASLRIRAVSPEPPLLAHISRESRGTFRQKTISLAPLNGWTCAVEICHDGMFEDTNSLDGAHLVKVIRLHNRHLSFFPQNWPKSLYYIAGIYADYVDVGFRNFLFINIYTRKTLELNSVQFSHTTRSWRWCSDQGWVWRLHLRKSEVFRILFVSQRLAPWSLFFPIYIHDRMVYFQYALSLPTPVRRVYSY